MPTSPTSAPNNEAEPSLDPAESLRIIEAQAAKVRSREPDARLIFGLWGVAWLVGYLALYLTASGRIGGQTGSDAAPTPATWAFILFAICIVGAMVTTIIYSIRANDGVVGASATFGAMYGWTWCLGFLGMATILGGLSKAGADDTVVALAANALSCLVVGVLYLAGGAFWRDRGQYIIGIWILLVGVGSIYAGLPNAYFLMAVLGGGGFFAGAVLEHLLRNRRTPAMVGP